MSWFPGYSMVQPTEGTNACPGSLGFQKTTLRDPINVYGFFLC